MSHMNTDSTNSAATGRNDLRRTDDLRSPAFSFQFPRPSVGALFPCACFLVIPAAAGGDFMRDRGNGNRHGLLPL